MQMSAVLPCSYRCSRLVWQAPTSLDIVGTTLICVQQYQCIDIGLLLLKVAPICERAERHQTNNDQPAISSCFSLFGLSAVLQDDSPASAATLLSSRRLLQAVVHAYRHSRQSPVPHEETIITGFVRDCVSTNSNIYHVFALITTFD